MPNSGLEGTNHTLFQTKMVEIDTLFQPKRLKKTFWLGTYLYSLNKGLPPSPPPPRPRGEKRVADYEYRCLRERE